MKAASNKLLPALFILLAALSRWPNHVFPPNFSVFYALAFCDNAGRLRYQTPTYPSSLSCNPPADPSVEGGSVVRLRQGPLHVVKHPMLQGSDRLGSLILVHDMSFVERRSTDTRHYLIGMFVVLGVIVSLVTVSIAHLSWRGWVAGCRSAGAWPARRRC